MQNPHNPPYAATVLFELYEQNGNHYVQIFYKNTTDENIPPLYIPDCGQKCPLEKFSEIYKSIIPTLDFEAECRLSLFSLTYEEAEFSPYQSSKCSYPNVPKINSIYIIIYSIGILQVLLQWFAFL